ncbi:hypothetical protein D3C87_1803460 [compost metagenome]
MICAIWRSVRRLSQAMVSFQMVVPFLPGMTWPMAKSMPSHGALPSARRMAGGLSSP